MKKKDSVEILKMAFFAEAWPLPQTSTSKEEGERNPLFIVVEYAFPP
ncbi:hypothetical protein J2129_000689 [Methanofollis sp. W23]|nr:hypothetical protein [Methanofollis sp. W23]MBP2145235.1 hypothetical protein [Methanofollis sp. W23]